MFFKFIICSSSEIYTSCDTQWFSNIHAQDDKHFYTEENGCKE